MWIEPDIVFRLTDTHIPLLMDGQICILRPKSPHIHWNLKPGLCCIPKQYSSLGNSARLFNFPFQARPNQRAILKCLSKILPYYPQLLIYKKRKNAGIACSLAICFCLQIAHCIQTWNKTGREIYHQTKQQEREKDKTQTEKKPPSLSEIMCFNVYL